MSAHQRNVMYATDTVATCLHLAGMGGSPRMTRRDLGFVRASGARDPTPKMHHKPATS